MLTSSTAGVTAYQTDAPQPSPPPPPSYGGSFDTTPMLIGATLVLAAFLVLALSHGHGHHHDLSPD